MRAFGSNFLILIRDCIIAHGKDHREERLSVVWSGRNTSMDFSPILSPLKKAAATTSQSAKPSSRTDHRPRTEVLPKPTLDALEDQTTHPAGQIWGACQLARVAPAVCGAQLRGHVPLPKKASRTRPKRAGVRCFQPGRAAFPPSVLLSNHQARQPRQKPFLLFK